MATFSDDFNRADAATLGTNWNGATNWSIVTNRAAAISSTFATVYSTPCATDDNSSQVTVAVVGGSTLGVVCRWASSDENGYIWRSNGTDCTLFSVVGGFTYNVIGSYSHTLVNGTVLKVTAVGSTITGYIDGVARVTVTDTAVTSGKYVGMRADSGGRFDDWSGADISTTLTASGSDTEALTDSGALVASASRSDVEALTDSVSSSITLVRSATDTLGVTDARTMSVAPARSDTEALTDSVTAVASTVRAYADTLGLTDTATVTLVMARAFADIAPLTDTVEASLVLSLSYLDSLGIIDAVTGGVIEAVYGHAGAFDARGAAMVTAVVATGYGDHPDDGYADTYAEGY